MYCLYRLYYDWQVSIMMQYFKRPHMIQPFIYQMVKCNVSEGGAGRGCSFPSAPPSLSSNPYLPSQAEVPLELLVNVDHPQDNEPWAWASYKTKGIVVPVFSNNVHEVSHLKVENQPDDSPLMLFSPTVSHYRHHMPTNHPSPSTPHKQVRSYNRLAPMARGDYLIMAADDDHPPEVGPPPGGRNIPPR